MSQEKVLGRHVRRQFNELTLQFDPYVWRAGKKERRTAVLSIVNWARGIPNIKHTKLSQRWIDAASIIPIDQIRLAKWIVFQKENRHRNLYDEVLQDGGLNFLIRLGHERRFIWLIFAVGDRVLECDPQLVIKSVGSKNFVKQENFYQALEVATAVVMNSRAYQEFEEWGYATS